MKHLDEDTIHAWLDGALTAQEARECEEHSASCEACRAAVAEARGLIAGASRILSALDDVPAGVVPAGTGRPKPRRNWTRTLSWAMAATVVVAVGLKVATRTPHAATATRSTPAASPPVTETAAANVAEARRAPMRQDSASPPVPQNVVTTGVTGAEPKAGVRQTVRGAAGGMARAAAPAAPAVNEAVVADVAPAARDTSMNRGIPVCYTNGVEHLMLDTATVGGDMPGWRVLRNDGQVGGRWRVTSGDSITLIFTQPMQRMLVGVVRPGGLDLHEMGSGAGVWMGRTSCEAAGR